MSSLPKTISEYGKKQSPDYKSLINEQIELECCRKSCLYFMSHYVKVQVRAAGTPQIITWEPWPYLQDLLETLQSRREVIILKARQLGITTCIVGYCLWKALFHPNVKVLFISQGQAEADDLIGGGDTGAAGKAKFMWSQLPPFLRLKLGTDSKQQIDFPANNSSLVALPSTEKAGRSTDATIVVRDELERHPYAEANFTAIGPTVDAGGQLIEMSTTDKFKADTHFKEEYLKARNGTSTKYALFLPWNLRPIRQEGLSLNEWFNEHIRKKYKDWEVEQEYPATEREALESIKTRQFFDVDSLEAMFGYIQKPVKCDIDEHGGLVEVYKPPVIGRKYCAFTDPSEGIEDPFHTVVIDAMTYEGVAEAHGMVKADIAAKIHDELVRAYNNAYNSYEVNSSAGGKFDDTIKALETPSIAPRRDVDDKIQKDKRGWYTTPNLKRKMLWGLEEAVRRRLVTTHRRETIEEWRNFIIPEGKDPQARSGCHDDTVIAWAGVWQIRKFAPIAEFTITSSKYKD